MGLAARKRFIFQADHCADQCIFPDKGSACIRVDHSTIVRLVSFVRFVEGGRSAKVSGEFTGCKHSHVIAVTAERMLQGV